MTDLRKAAEMALEALEGALSDDQPYIEKSKKAAEALRQALAQEGNHESLRLATKDYIQELEDRIDEYILKEEQQEPVAWMGVDSWGVVTKFRTNPFRDAIPLYKTPPKREWVGLTDAQVEEIAEYHGIDGLYETSRIDFYRAIEITLKEKNT